MRPSQTRSVYSQMPAAQYKCPSRNIACPPRNINRGKSTQTQIVSRFAGTIRSQHRIRNPPKRGNPYLNQRNQRRDTGHSNQSALQGAALYCKPLPGCTEPTHSPEPLRDRDTEFARNERGKSREQCRNYGNNIAARWGNNKRIQIQS